MKHILLTSIILISLASCKAQQIITPIFNNPTPAHTPNNYYKDVDGDFDKFIGTWKFQNTDAEFIIELRKELHYLTPSNYYKDLLIGEYLYKKNNIIQINTLENMDNSLISGYQHSVSGKNIIHKANTPVCDACTIQERRVQLLISLPNHNHIMGWLTLRHIIDNGIEKLEATINNASIMGYDMIDFNKMPWGNFTLIKQ